MYGQYGLIFYDELVLICSLKAPVPINCNSNEKSKQYVAQNVYFSVPPKKGLERRGSVHFHFWVNFLSKGYENVSHSATELFFLTCWKTFFKLQHQLSHGTTFSCPFLHAIYTNTSTYNCPKMLLLHYLERVLQLLVWKATEVAIRLLNGPGSPHLIRLPTHFSNKSHLKLSRFL